MRRRPGDRGVTIVEAAFALPILLTFIFGLVDLGMWTFNANQATNAARDGARAAIIDYEAADVGGPNRDAIVAAVERRLAGRAAEEVNIRCVRADGSAVACSSASVDLDRIQVDVRWTWHLLTPIAAILGQTEGRAAGSATMQIVGRPLPGSGSSTTTTSTTTTTAPSTTTPGDCAVSTFTVSPSPVKTTGGGSSQLSQELIVTFTTNGSAGCVNLWVELYNSKDGKRAERVECGCGEGPTFSWSYKGSDNVWKAGTGEVRILKGTVVLQSKTFQVVQGP